VPLCSFGTCASMRDGDAVHVLFLALYPSPHFAGNLRRVVSHLNTSSDVSGLLHFHAVVHKTLPEISSWCTQYTLSSMPEEAQMQHQNLSHGKAGRANVYLWKAFLYRLVPLHKVIVLDLDVVLVSGSSLRDLWLEFDAFGSQEVFAAMHEQGPTYAALGKGVGLNGGVQLHHLARMRATAAGEIGTAHQVLAYNEIVHRCASNGCKGWDRAEPSLGDQTLFTHICMHQPHLCRVLPCGWNRQVSTRYYTAAHFVKDWHKCSTTCHLLHFNQPLLEGIVPRLQLLPSPPNCSDCRAALAYLENKTRHSGSRNPKFTWGQSKQYMATQIEACCCKGTISSQL
jgi:hypothetical protein